MKPVGFTEVLTYFLTDEDRRQLSEEMTAQILERETLKDKKKKIDDSYTNKIKSADLRLKEIAELMEEGSEDRAINCEWRPYWPTYEVIAYRLDTFEEINRRPMTPEERQTDLFNFEPKTVEENQEAVNQVFVEPCGECGENDGHHPLCSQYQLGEGTPVNTVLDEAEIERIKEFYCDDKIGEEKPIKLCYIAEAPYVIVAYRPNEVDAWPALPLDNCSVDEVFYYRDAPEPFTYQNLKVNCGSKSKPDWWVLVGPQIVFTVKQDVEQLANPQEEIGADGLTAIEALQSVLGLVIEEQVTIETIRGWTDEQRQEAEAWAVAAHMRANDHEDVTVPRRPDCLLSAEFTLKTSECQGCGALVEMDLSATDGKCSRCWTPDDIKDPEERAAFIEENSDPDHFELPSGMDVVKAACTGTFSSEDNFTAPRCDECGMIDGAHAPTCSKRPGAITPDDYLAYAKAHYNRNHQSFARKLALKRDHDDEISQWLALRSEESKAKEATTV